MYWLVLKVVSKTSLALMVAVPPTYAETCPAPKTEAAEAAFSAVSYLPLTITRESHDPTEQGIRRIGYIGTLLTHVLSSS